MRSKDRLCALVVGPTNKNNIFKFGKVNRTEFMQFKNEIAGVLIKHLHTINIIPASGIPLEIAKDYKRLGGKVIGYIPRGYSGLEKNFNSCSEVREIDWDWTSLNTCLSLKGDLIVGFGISAGTFVEIAYTRYHRDYLNKNLPILLDERTISSRLNLELEQTIDINYFSSMRELNKLFYNIRNGK